MSIQTELARITNAKAAIKTAIEGKGVTVPDGTLLDGMAALIESIEAGGGESVEISKGKIYPNENINCANGATYSILHGLSGEPDLFFLFAAGSSYNTKNMIKTAQYMSSKLSELLAYAGCTYQYGTTIHTDYYTFGHNTLGDVSVGPEDVKISVGVSKDLILVSGKYYYWLAARWK